MQTVQDITDKVTVVLLTYNCANRVKETLEHLTHLTGKPAIIAVDNHSTDGTVELLRRYKASITVLPLDDNIGAAARNKGAETATTPYIAFADDDTWWEDGALQKVVDYFEAYPQLTVINAKILVGTENRIDPISAEMQQSPLPAGDLPGHTLVSFMGGANAMRRGAFLAAGGYEPRLFLGGEEELLATDLMVRGGQLRYLPDVIVHHHPSRASVDALRWYGVRNALWFVWRRRSPKNAWRWTKHIYATSGRWTFLKGLIGFMAGLLWVITTRKPVPRWLEQDLERIDQQRLGNQTRSYGKPAVQA
jgi:N-acetylglucosaminyl-diphospho-decaprenol L-rhamnosyltransferase